MTCTDCRAEGADCLTADRVRVCSDCLYERAVKERDEARAALSALDTHWLAKFAAETTRASQLEAEGKRLRSNSEWAMTEREQALRERDEARKYAEERNDEANKLQRLLNMAARERDEARAEVETLRAAIDGEPWGGAVLKRQRDEAIKKLGVTMEQLWDAEKQRDEARKYAEACEWALEAEQEYTARLKADLALECREVAEAQREACAKVAYLYADLNYDSDTVEAKVQATPLVTEGEP